MADRHPEGTTLIERDASAGSGSVTVRVTPEARVPPSPPPRASKVRPPAPPPWPTSPWRPRPGPPAAWR